MEKLIKQLNEGNFKYMDCVIKLDSGNEIWATNGWLSYSFYPNLNTKFTLKEKWRIRRALKNGLIKQSTSQFTN